MIAVALKHMLAAGMDHDAIVAAVSEMEAAAPKDAQAERRRAADRERKRLRNSAETAETAEFAEQVSPKKETSPTPPKEKTTPSTSEANASSRTPREALETVLDAERADAVIAHRKRIGKPMTLRAAELLAGKFARCAEPNVAADAMLANGWQGFEPEWLDRRQARAGPPSFQKPSPIDHFRNYASEINGRERDDGSVSGYRDDASGLPVRAIEHHR